MNILCSTGSGLRIDTINIMCPTVADDMALISLTKFGLQFLMNICYLYARMWRFLCQALKCAVIVFNESSASYTRSQRHCYLGDEAVSERSKYIHLGIELDKTMNSHENITESCSQIRRTFFAILKSGLCESDLHPLTLRKIYETIVVPRVLCGCELWQNINLSKFLMLERFQGEVS